MGATFAATEAIVANQREVDDSLNGAAGACAAGFLAGVKGAFSYNVGLCLARSLRPRPNSTITAYGRRFVRCAGRGCWHVRLRR
jgi:hypothetical protein